jgi:hypothetical protein
MLKAMSADKSGERLCEKGWRLGGRATHPPLVVWRYYYNGRADCENAIKELQAGFALPTLCLEQFWPAKRH